MVTSSCLCRYGEGAGFPFQIESLELGAAIVGSDATVKAGLEKVVGETGADEVIVVTDTYEHADRLESYRRVAGVAAMIEVKPTVAVGA